MIRSPKMKAKYKHNLKLTEVRVCSIVACVSLIDFGRSVGIRGPSPSLMLSVTKPLCPSEHVHHAPRVHIRQAANRAFVLWTEASSRILLCLTDPRITRDKQ